MTKELSKLEKVAGKIAGAVIGIESFLCHNNYNGLHASGLQIEDRFRWLPIQESHFGDVPEIFTAIVASGFIGDKLREYGRNSGGGILEFCGKHFSKFVAAAIGTYYTLGETVVPELLPGTPDMNDVPAVIVTSVAAPIFANYFVKSWNDGLKQKFYNLFKSESVALEQVA